MSKFHERFNQLKDECGVLQKDLAQALGVTQQSLSYYMNGREPNYDLLIKIAEYFGCSCDYLLGVSEVKNVERDIDAKKEAVTEAEKFVEGISRLDGAVEFIENMNFIIDRDNGLQPKGYWQGLLLALGILTSTFSAVKRYVADTVKKEKVDMSAFVDVYTIINLSNATSNEIYNILYSEFVFDILHCSEAHLNENEVESLKRLCKSYLDIYDKKEKMTRYSSESNKTLIRFFNKAGEPDGNDKEN